MKNESFDMFFIEQVSFNEMLSIIKKFKDKTTAGHDGLSV